MKEEANSPSVGDKARQAVKDVGEERKKVIQEINPRIKTGLYIAGLFGLLWASQYIFSALAGAIRSFKDLRKSIREK